MLNLVAEILYWKCLFCHYDACVFIYCKTGGFNQLGNFDHYEATLIRCNIRLSSLEIINFTQQVAVKKIAAQVCGSAMCICSCRSAKSYRKPIANLWLQNTSRSFAEFQLSELSLNLRCPSLGISCAKLLKYFLFKLLFNIIYLNSFKL